MNENLREKFDNLKNHVPNILSISRIMFSPLLFFFIIFNFEILAIFSFLYCVLSDIVDGYLARKLDTCSTIGGYLDAIADFFFVFLGLISFTIKTVYPFWVLILISIIFIQFLLTSDRKNPVYDPLGKYYGTFLMFMIWIALIDYEKCTVSYLPLILLVYSFSAITSRIIALKNF